MAARFFLLLTALETYSHVPFILQVGTSALETRSGNSGKERSRDASVDISSDATPTPPEVYKTLNDSCRNATQNATQSTTTESPVKTTPIHYRPARLREKVKSFRATNSEDVSTAANTRNKIEKGRNNLKPSSSVPKKRADSIQECQDMMSDDHDIITGNTSGTVLNINGLFALTGEYRAGLTYLAAALIAVKIINQDPYTLPGYTLKINVHDTKVSETNLLH
ncbi:hypothetical protein PoB_006672800 [Plakobranchus ocellatus]|uniref:Uncharacterized protein n=1 Tax=Plakobranchus ocellatus TaxID=259542 RepID=A0AAV4D840_9GAST|nr:hypothetical protein PoB_006672800 [Plakobranchus ocellatus]